VADTSFSKIDVEIVLFVVDGGVLQLLSGNKVDKGKLLEGVMRFEYTKKYECCIKQ
jgi:hypothetical protein